jgi:aspartyl-tRNA(Asn)/glutamyl-tRNA(Gln) amidotransferase subunit B
MNRAGDPYEPVIGLECHVQLLCRSKAFSAASAAFGGEPNTQTDPYTLGLPGTLPVLNRRAVEFALRMGLACGCRIRQRSRFARKHYFYPDLPKGYQISQYDEPLCEGGHIEFTDSSGALRRVRLTRIHMEEDAGKNLHAPGEGVSLIDLNRAGVPLIEIVSEPDLHSAEEAGRCLRAIRQLVRYLGISDGNMEEGSLRCDANVSVRRRGETRLGTKTELKNINSFRFVERAIEHEIARQIGILESGGQVVQETRGWDAERGTSHSQRSKEEAHDYRYFPDPDLPPLVIDAAWLEEIQAGQPELPQRRRTRYVADLGLAPADADLLSAERELSDYFDQTLRHVSDARAAARTAAALIGTELLGALNRDGRTIAASPLPPDALAELIDLLLAGTISGKIAKEVLHKAYAGGGRPRDIIAAEGLVQVTDEAAILAACQKVVADEKNRKQVEKYRAGQEKLLGFFVGQVMRESGGRLGPERVNEVLRRLLKGTS